MAPRGGPARIVALEGMSGIGKSRVAAALAARPEGFALLPEAYDTLDPRPSLSVPDRPSLWAVERRLFREEVRRYRRAVGLRGRGGVVVADTGFLGPLTYCVGLAALDPDRDVVAPLRALYLRAAAAGTLGLPDLTIVLDASAATRRRRLRGDPDGHPPAWRRRHARIGAIERGLWTGALTRALGARVISVSAAGPPETVADRVLARLDRRQSPPALAPAASARRLVQLLGGPAFGKR